MIVYMIIKTYIANSEIIIILVHVPRIDILINQWSIDYQSLEL